MSRAVARPGKGNLAHPTGKTKSQPSTRLEEPAIAPVLRADAESVTESQGHAQHTSRNACRWIGWKPTFNRETLQTVVPFELVALDLGLRFFGHIVRVAGPPSMI